LKYYAHWLPDPTGEQDVGRLDQTRASATPAQPGTNSDQREETVSLLESVVSSIFASWNRLERWLRQIEGLRRLA